ncbi:Uncharacterised protein [Slackia heliotrinireducens]|uniref:Uncharacterized protein n=1 Tax=Slackia heliotrinireducens (strain ATCC 29202 / DSM 20476 / NCTC 11029 / RHS 1) TaxID=471855 RepID=C7N7K6_SLAHD|nr:hypothetical protein [Slackia heliotrinireducens]ACV22891.1 hypothetical protein Shel_18750 [Slackia heliotrinireducens DSM 20476]VEH01676.1 Uncharacterised protein [Slackia heliotrinireducens]
MFDGEGESPGEGACPWPRVQGSKVVDGRLGSPIEFMVGELATGKHITRVCGSPFEEASTFRRKDGVRPASLGGLDPKDDVALRYFQEFFELDAGTRTWALRELKVAVRRAEGAAS